MHSAFEPLVTRAEPLGNPARKHLRAVERHGERLLCRLEAASSLSQIHLDRSAPSPGEDFGRIAAASPDPEERLALLGTFFAVQLLHQNASMLEQLAVDLEERPDRTRCLAAFLERGVEEYSLLVSTYVEQVLRVVLPDGPRRFAFLSVGTPGHQDDLDAAMIDANDEGRPALERSFARLASQFQRYASPLDNYLASAAGAPGFCISVPELRAALDAGRLGFVVVTELMGAELLAGDQEYLLRLRDEVTAECGYRRGEDNSRHELFLRGLLGETRALILRIRPSDEVNPKDDALRLILGLATAFRTIEGIDSTRPGAVLTDLATLRPGLREPLLRLERSRVFLEAFRQASQLLISQDEKVDVVGEAARENLARVARALGYRNQGPVHAVDHLLVHYHEAVLRAHEAAVPLMDDVARHLTRISRFSGWSRAHPPSDLAERLGEMLFQGTRQFSGVRFYDDLIESVTPPDGSAWLEAFTQGFCRLPALPRWELAERYADWGRDAPYTFFTLVTLLAGHVARGHRESPLGELVDAFLDRLSNKTEAVRSLSRVFRFYPALANRFLLALTPDRLQRFRDAIDVGIGSPEVTAARDRLLAFIRVHRRSSRYIKRVLARVTERHPVTVQALSDDAMLRRLALGRRAASERHPSPETQKGLLGDFYDIEFLRIAMGTLRGEPAARVRTAFAELTTTYLSRLFDFCFRQVEQETGGWTSARDRVAVLLSGGNARFRPYDEDYDLLALVDDAEPASRLFYERVIAVMNSQIARRGVIAQYRLAEWLGRFAATLDEVAELLCGDRQELFVDRCQLLGSKVIVGSRHMTQGLRERVLRPHIFDKADLVHRQAAREITERRQELLPCPEGVLHLKEAEGGLREIDLSLAAAKARLGVWESPGQRPFQELARLDPGRAPIYERLDAANDLLVAVRSAYRVTVAATATVEREHLSAPARILGFTDRDGVSGPDRLFTEVQSHLSRSAEAIDELFGLDRGGSPRT